MQRVKRMILAIGLLLAVFAAIESYSILLDTSPKKLPQTIGKETLAKDVPATVDIFDKLGLPQLAVIQNPAVLEVSGFQKWIRVNSVPQFITEPTSPGG